MKLDRTFHFAPFALGLLLITASNAVAQTASPSSVSGAADALDLSVPESPAFTVLGLSPTTVTRPATPKALATSLLTGVDKNGVLQSGVALDFAPYRLVEGPNLTLADYGKSSLGGYFLRLVTNTEISVATVKGQSATSPASQLALGLHTVLFNKGDLVTDTELTKAYAKVIASYPLDPLSTTTQIAEYTNTIDQLLKKEYQKAAGRLESKPIWTAAIAPVFISDSGNVDDLKWNGYGYWTSFSFGAPFDKTSTAPSQFILHAEMRMNEHVASSTGVEDATTQDRSLLGLSYRFGSPNFKFSLEGGAQKIRLQGESWQSSNVLSVVAEPHVTQGVWLSLSLDHDSSGKEGPVGSVHQSSMDSTSVG